MAFADQQGMGSPRGIMVLKAEHRERTIGGQPDGFALFPITQSGCHVRLYPELDANGQPMPIRTGRGLRDVGLWVCGDHYGIRYLGGNDPGKEKLTLLLTIKGDERCSDPAQRRGLRVWDQLRGTLYHRLDAGTAPPHWSRWVSNDKNSTFGPAGKSKAKPFALVRGMLTHYVTGTGPLRGITPQTPKLNCILIAPPAAQATLIEMVMQELDSAKNYQGDDFDRVFTYNSKLVHPTTGCLISFGRKGMSDPRVAAQTQAPAQVSFNAAACGAAAVDSEAQYKVEATVLDFSPHQPVPIPLEYLQRFCMPPWDEILKTWEDEADLVSALEVGFPDDLIIEAFRDEPGWLSDRLRAKSKQALAAAQGGAFVPAAAAAPPGPSASTPAAPVSSGDVAPAITIPALPDNPATAPAAVPSAAPAKAPWEGASAPLPAVNIPNPMPGAEVAAPPGAQPDGTAPQGMDEMMKALQNAESDSGSATNPATGTSG